MFAVLLELEPFLPRLATRCLASLKDECEGAVCWSLPSPEPDVLLICHIVATKKSCWCKVAAGNKMEKVGAVSRSNQIFFTASEEKSVAVVHRA